MPDISMCTDSTCPERAECFRYRARPSEFRQSFYAEQIRTDDGCTYKLPLRGDDQSRLRTVEEVDAWVAKHSS